MFRAWLLELVNGEPAFAISEQVLTSVIRITTHPRIFREPTALADAITFTESIQQHPNCRVVRSSPQHWSSFVRLCKTTNAKANLITDAWFAALAIESGCTWITTDRDFRASPGSRGSIPSTIPPPSRIPLSFLPWSLYRALVHLVDPFEKPWVPAIRLRLGPDLVQCVAVVEDTVFHDVKDVRRVADIVQRIGVQHH